MIQLSLGLLENTSQVGWATGLLLPTTPTGRRSKRRANKRTFAPLLD